VTGKCGSIWVRLIPAPRGTGIVSAPVPKKLLQMAGIEDCYTSAKGSTGTLGNFGKLKFHLLFSTRWSQIAVILTHYTLMNNRL
jgi:small subunit ribosomal protein S2e